MGVSCSQAWDHIMRVFNVREGSDRYIVTADPGCSCFRLNFPVDNNAITSIPSFADKEQA